ncbi:hypothetical protein HK405_015986, partial [Cladochytrium tenue]
GHSVHDDTRTTADHTRHSNRRPSIRRLLCLHADAASARLPSGSRSGTRTLSIALATAAAAILLVGALLPPSAAATNNNYPNTAGDASDSAVALHEPASATSESLSEHLRLEQFDDGRVLSLFNFSRSFRPAAVDAVSS